MPLRVHSFIALLLWFAVVFSAFAFPWLFVDGWSLWLAGSATFLLGLFCWRIGPTALARRLDLCEVEAPSSLRELAMRAEIRLPKLFQSDAMFGNALSFGCSQRSACIVVPPELFTSYAPELRDSILAHETAHIKSGDAATLCFLSVIPSSLHSLIVNALYPETEEEFESDQLIKQHVTRFELAFAMCAAVLFALTQTPLAVASMGCKRRADRMAVSFGIKPTILATALYRMVHDSVERSSFDMRHLRTIAPLLFHDPFQAPGEIAALLEMDANYDRAIDQAELKNAETLRVTRGWLTPTQLIMSLFTFHPTAASRIKTLSQIDKVQEHVGG